MASSHSDCTLNHRSAHATIFNVLACVSILVVTTTCHAFTNHHHTMSGNNGHCTTTTRPSSWELTKSFSSPSPRQLIWHLNSSVQSQTTSSKKKKSNNKKKSNKTNGAASEVNDGQPLSIEELTDHVSSKYIQGPGGPLDEKVRTRGLKKSTLRHTKPLKTRADVDATSDGDTAGDGGLWNEKQEEYLQMLNGRPALVLNANYMVRIFVRATCTCLQFICSVTFLW
jgi:hypothetical protein